MAKNPCSNVRAKTPDRHCLIQAARMWHAKMTSDDFLIKKNLVSLTIGKTLIDIDSRRYSEVSKLLDEKYHADISDCYEHPGRLREILQELYGNSSKFMIDSIRDNLSGFPDHAEIAKFLSALSG